MARKNKQDDSLTTLSPNPSEKIKGKVLTASALSFSSGPVPHPDILKGYGELSSGFPERILKMAEEEAKHTREV
ncbi:MAG: DUF2335 domain-containing protein [Nitrospirae bacterium]|uniref:DUF2335 domain-containing protein n=1 Tax=Candidatus Magnetobacterium casense TaxID=1455061 RepID=UPI00058B7A5D|nr:DUF2335 domain-containing protein [Candidatus Magnetobacterium casensis]MBF0337834.1 DUF2335 domain-containing protein [Nitrospirota bacterium]